MKGRNGKRMEERRGKRRDKEKGREETEKGLGTRQDKFLATV